MISISTINQNINGNVIINTAVDFKENTVRLSRSATLDGGAVLTNSGFSDGDRNILVRKDYISKTEADKIWSLFQTEPFILISIEDGVYYGAMKTVRIRNGALSMLIYIKNKENE